MKPLITILVSVIIFQSVGCVRTQFLKPEKHFIDLEQNITVHLKDKRRITFSEGNFDIHKTDSTEYIQGYGLFETKYDAYQKFNGKIDFQEIEKISSPELTPYAPYIMTTIMMPIAAIVMLMTWQPKSH